MNKFRRITGLSISLLLIAAAGVSAQSNGVKKHGVVYNIAEDRQVEKVGGIYEPEGLDKYMQRRFDALESRMSQIEDQIGKMHADLQKSLEEIRASQKENSVLSS